MILEYLVCYVAKNKGVDYVCSGSVYGYNKEEAYQNFLNGNIYFVNIFDPTDILFDEISQEENILSFDLEREYKDYTQLNYQVQQFFKVGYYKEN